MTAPTATLADGALRAELEQAGLGFGAEFGLIEAARTPDPVTCAYATSPKEAHAAAAAGALAAPGAGAAAPADGPARAGWCGLGAIGGLPTRGAVPAATGRLQA